jgi:hypothetical protein
MDTGQEHAAIGRAEATDLSNIETVARTTWPVAYAGIIPDEIERRLLDSWYSPESLSLALAAQGSTFLVAEWRRSVIGFAQYMRRSTVSVERENILGRRFYERMAFGEPRELTQEMQGYSLKLVEYRRSIP